MAIGLRRIANFEERVVPLTKDNDSQELFVAGAFLPAIKRNHSGLIGCSVDPRHDLPIDHTDRNFTSIHSSPRIGIIYPDLGGSRRFDYFFTQEAWDRARLIDRGLSLANLADMGQELLQLYATNAESAASPTTLAHYFGHMTVRATYITQLVRLDDIKEDLGDMINNPEVWQYVTDIQRQQQLRRSVGFATPAAFMDATKNNRTMWCGESVIGGVVSYLMQPAAAQYVSTLR